MRTGSAPLGIICFATAALLALGAAAPPAKPKWLYLWGSGTVKLPGGREYHVNVYRAPLTEDRFLGHITFDLGLRAQDFEFEGRVDGDRVTLTVKRPKYVHPHSPVWGGGKYVGRHTGGKYLGGTATLEVMGRDPRTGLLGLQEKECSFGLELYPPVLRFKAR
jgi:hypothetical protein